MDPYLKDKDVCFLMIVFTFYYFIAVNGRWLLYILFVCLYACYKDEDSVDLDDTTISPEDSVIICARNEDDVSHLEARNS